MAEAAAIDTRLDRLRERQGTFPVETATYELSEQAYERAHTLHEQGIPGAARVWVERDDEALLVREERRPESWGVAGGLIEPDESAEQAGRREVREETGIDCAITDVAYVHRATREHETGDRDPIEELAVVFIATYQRGEIDPQDGEIAAAAWWSQLPETVHSPADRIGAERLA